MKDSLVLDKVEKRYGDFVALEPTNLTIKAGEFITLLGPSGSGKTTILMSIAGFVAPSSGRMVLDGRDVTALPPERRNFGVVFQGYALFPHLTVYDNVAFPLRARGITGEAARPKIVAALETAKLQAFAHRYPRQLSGGQQQRVALARSLVFAPELLLLDEPLSALDKALRKEFQTEFRSIHREVGSTFIYVTHDQEEALTMSDRIVILDRGRILQIAPPAELYERPATEFVAGFLGKSNFLRGKIASISGGHVEIHMPGFAATAVVNGIAARAGEAAVAALRPEKIRLAASAASAEAAPCQVRGRVGDITYLGAAVEVEVKLTNGETLLATVPAGQRSFAEGEEIVASWAPDAAILVCGSEASP
ncbi:ABC transporter ATP-binding protein [Bosea sp. 2KB_26]|uniref:ABC transporter ATP-binding protein n=1 Tax=Bosea sp. 2KB_26 TaxID=3237475 RepID=UPI003F920A84